MVTEEESIVVVVSGVHDKVSVECMKYLNKIVVFMDMTVMLDIVHCLGFYQTQCFEYWICSCHQV